VCRTSRSIGDPLRAGGRVRARAGERRLPAAGRADAVLDRRLRLAPCVGLSHGRSGCVMPTSPRRRPGSLAAVRPGRLRLVGRRGHPRGPQARGRIAAPQPAQRLRGRPRLVADLGGTYNNQRDRSAVQLWSGSGSERCKGLSNTSTPSGRSLTSCEKAASKAHRLGWPAGRLFAAVVHTRSAVCCVRSPPAPPH
jgi:hypothetical protein